MDATRTTSPGTIFDPSAGARPGWDRDEALATVRREAGQLPVLREAKGSRRRPRTWAGVELRLQAALWEVAARSDIRVTPGTSIDQLARRLVGYGLIIPPAGDAVRALAFLVEDGSAGRTAPGGPMVDEAAGLAERLSGYLALRAAFG